MGLIEKQSTNRSAAYKLIFQLGVLTINPIACASRRLSYLIKKCRPDMSARNPVPMAVLLLFIWQQFRIIGYIFKNKMTVHSGLVLFKRQCVCVSVCVRSPFLACGFFSANLDSCRKTHNTILFLKPQIVTGLKSHDF